MSGRPVRAAVLISGRGSNMLALAKACERPGFPARIALVLSDKADAPGLALASDRKIPTRVIPRADFASREEHDDALNAALGAAGIELVCLAGYMRLLSWQFVEKWLGRMINIHPALLPAFKGLDPHAQALAAGVRLHGCTVHFVTFETDSGPIIAQAAVPVLTSDTAETLAARVLAAEHRLYPMGLELVASGKAKMEGAATVFSGLAELTASPVIAPLLPHATGAADFESLARLTP